MAKLYFKYGVMGSSKTAQALITKFNYEEGNNKVLFLKPSIDNRDGFDKVRSRIGLEATAIVVDSTNSIENDILLNKCKLKPDVIICDESQFFTEDQINELKNIAYTYDIPVLCFGLLTDFQTHLFSGSKRLIEIADSIQEIKMVCSCGKKAQINARIIDGKITTSGEQIFIGGNESYKAMCYSCWNRARKENDKIKTS